MKDCARGQTCGSCPALKKHFGTILEPFQYRLRLREAHFVGQVWQVGQVWHAARQ